MYISRAADLAPDRVAGIDTFFIVEHLDGENRGANRNIQQARAKAPGNPEMVYHQAIIKAVSGEEVAAISLLEELLG